MQTGTLTLKHGAAANKELKSEWDQWFSAEIKIDDAVMPEYKVGDSIATRSSGEKAINAVAEAMPNLFGGSADLGPSNKTVLKGKGDYTSSDRAGRNFHFGIREHGMGGCCKRNGSSRRNTRLRLNLSRVRRLYEAGSKALSANGNSFSMGFYP